MDIFAELPNTLKNMIIKKSAGCGELTHDGKKCSEKFIYSVNDYLFSGEKLKKIMVNCTRFCLKHIPNMILHGELILGCESAKIENKSEKKIIKLSKDSATISGMKGDKTIFHLFYPFNNNKIDEFNFEFHKDVVDDIKYIEENMINKGIGYPEELYGGKNMYVAVFKDNVVAKFWKKFIRDCFVYEDIDRVELEVEGYTNVKEVLNSINSTMCLGNITLNITEIRPGEEKNLEEEDDTYIKSINIIKIDKSGL